MTCKNGHFDVVKLMVNNQFECSTCEWNDSFWFSLLSTVIRYSRVYICLGKKKKEILSKYSIGLVKNLLPMMPRLARISFFVQKRDLWRITTRHHWCRLFKYEMSTFLQAFCQISTYVSIIFFLIASSSHHQAEKLSVFLTLLVSTLLRKKLVTELQIMTRDKFRTFRMMVTYFFLKKVWPWHSFSTSQQDDVATLNLS